MEEVSQSRTRAEVYRRQVKSPRPNREARVRQPLQQPRDAGGDLPQVCHQASYLLGNHQPHAGRRPCHDHQGHQVDDQYREAARQAQLVGQPGDDGMENVGKEQRQEAWDQQLPQLAEDDQDQHQEQCPHGQAASRVAKQVRRAQAVGSASTSPVSASGGKGSWSNRLANT